MHIYQESHILCMNLWACATKAILQLMKMHPNSDGLHPWESLEYLIQFQCTYLTLFSPHTIDSIHFWKNTSLFPWQCDFPHKVRKTITMGIKKELVRLSDVIFQD